MLEGKFTTKLLSALRKHPELIRDNAIIWKIADRWTAGIPDFVIIRNGKSTWFECKIAPNTLSALQETFLRRMNCNAYVITYTKDKSVRIEDARDNDRAEFVGFDNAIGYIVVLSEQINRT